MNERGFKMTTMGTLVHASGKRIEDVELVRGEPLYVLIALAPGAGNSNSFYFDDGWSFEPAAPPLPAKVGAVIRATVRGVPNVRLMLDVGGRWASARDVEGYVWHTDRHIDPASVQIELEGLE